MAEFYPGSSGPLITFVSRESSEMPAVRVRGHGFAGVLRSAGMRAEVFSYADQLNAACGEREKTLRARDKLCLNLRALRRLHQPDRVLVIQRFNYHSLAPFLLKIAGQKLILDLDDWEAREELQPGRLPFSGAEAGMRLLARNSCFCLAASRFLFDYISRFNRNVAYVPTGVNTRVFQPQEKIPRPETVLSWIGTVHRPDNIENLRFLIECFKELTRIHSSVRLEIAAKGVYLDQLKELTADEKSICLVDWMPPERVPEYLSRVDIGVMPLIQPSRFNRAKSPTRLFEYMAMGKPVVCSPTGEAGEIIEDGIEGFLARNQDSFVIALKRLLESSRLQREMGLRGRQKAVQKYSLEIIGKELIRVFTGI